MIWPRTKRIDHATVRFIFFTFHEDVRPGTLSLTRVCAAPISTTARLPRSFHFCAVKFEPSLFLFGVIHGNVIDGSCPPTASFDGLVFAPVIRIARIPRKALHNTFDEQA